MPAMEVTVIMPLPIFGGFFDKCDKDSREFAILENGVVIGISEADHFERLVEIPCDIIDADRLLCLATTVYPEAVDDIAKAIAAVRRAD